MKELSIKEKAKRYDEALKVLHKYDGANIMFTQDLKEEMFPELKESDDEKIRKALVEMVHDTTGDSLWIDYNVHKEDALAWLEKQSMPQVRTGLEWVNTIDDACDKRYSEEYAHGEYCHEQSFKWGFQEGVDWLEKQGEQKPVISNDALREGIAHFGITQYQIDNWLKKYIDVEKQDEQKPTDKVEPKFKQGDWIVFNGLVLRVGGVSGGFYVTTSKDGITNGYDWSIDNVARLWTIQDAKDGDILCTYECDEPKIVFILKGVPKIHYALSYHCYYNIMYSHFDSDSEKGCLAPNDEDVKPATEEQRDLLFSKMEKAGYEWDSETKKIINNND